MPEFHFWESDWALHAQKGGKICVVAAVGLGILGFFFWSWFSSLFALLVGAFLATFELPGVYKMFEACRRLEDILNDKLFFRIPAVRGVVYTGLAIIMFLSISIQILTGILMLLTAVLYFFTQITGGVLTDQSAAGLPEAGAAAASAASAAGAAASSAAQGARDGKTPFGTFT